MTDAAQQQQQQQQEGEAQCLVSEFPNPPPYYQLFGSLPADAAVPPPPPIPTATLEATARRVADITAAVHQLRDEQRDTLVGADPTSAAAASAHAAIAEASRPPDNLAEVVSIFGEVVEDPLLRIADGREACDDPTDIAREMRSVTGDIVTTFVTLTQVLLQEPAAAREQLVRVSKLLATLLEESNRYREHQARENLIGVLEEQVAAKRRALAERERDAEATAAAMEAVGQLRGD